MEYYLAIRSTDTRYNMDEPSEHYTTWKNIVTNDYISQDSIYIKCPEQLERN